MYTVPLRYKTVLYDGNITVSWYGTIYLKDNTTAHFTLANISDGSGQLVKKCSDPSIIGIGNAYASELSIQFKDLHIDRYAMFDAVIDLYAKITADALRIWDDLSPLTWNDASMYTWDEITREVNFPMGKYVVKESMRTANDVKVTAYDFMVLFDEALPAAMTADAKIPFDWLQLACSTCGVTLGLSRREALRMPNGNRLLKYSNASAESKTWRDIVAQAAEAMGGNAIIGRDGKLFVRQYSFYPNDSIGSGERYSSDISDYQSYYTGIYLTFREGGIQDYQSNTTEQLDTGLSYDLGYNAFMQISDDGARRRAMKEIIDAQKKLKYTPFKASMPFNPAYDLMDVLEFFENQATHQDVAPITAITFRIGGKMDLSCGGEDPALQGAKSKETKAIESVSSGSGYNDDFWMVMNNAPENASVTINADTPTKLGEALFYAKEANSMFEVNYTATYMLEKSALVVLEVMIDDTVVYQTKENQFPEENRITVTTGCTTDTAGSHTISIWITITEATLDIGGGGVLMAKSVSSNGLYVAANDGVYGYSQVLAMVDDGVGYYVSAQDIAYTAAEARTYFYGTDAEYQSSAEVET